MHEGWATVQLGDVMERRTDTLGSATEPTVLTCTENHGLVDQLVHLGRRAATENVSKYKRVEPMDIVYNVYLLWLGAIGQNLTGTLGITSPVYEVFRPKGGIHPPYMGHLLRSPGMVERYASISIGTVPRRRRTPWEDFLRLTVALPPIEEQRRIVDLIRAVDDSIVEAEEVVGTTSNAVRMLINELFAACPTIDAGTLIASISAGKSPSALNRPPSSSEFGVLKVSAIQETGFRPEESKTVHDPGIFSPEMAVSRGDVLISRANTAERVGLVCYVEEDHPNLFLCDKTLRLQPAEGVDTKTLAYALQSDAARRQFQGAGTGTSGSMKNISQETIRSIVLKWPSETSSQRAIAGILDAASSTLATAKDFRMSVGSLRSELLIALLSGEHVIPSTYDGVMPAAV